MRQCQASAADSSGIRAALVSKGKALWPSELKAFMESKMTTAKAKEQDVTRHSGDSRAS